MIYKILMEGEEDDDGFDHHYYILLKEDDIDYIESVDKNLQHSKYHIIHLKREIQLRYGEEKTNSIELKDWTKMKVFPS
jgi:hypothetical protein